ncbi:MAG: hypothetical protein AAB214_02010 [Fibrobacterota bacterium]
MRYKGFLLGVAFLLGGCAERDNPFDPANRTIVYPNLDTSWVPVPSLHSKVFLPDSVKDRDPKFIGNLQRAFAEFREGDTLWIQGGDKIHDIAGVLNVRFGGSALMPSVIRTFGGRVKLRGLTSQGLPPDVCMTFGGTYVTVVGLTFMNCQTAIQALSRTGPLTFDSIEIQNCNKAFYLSDVNGRVKLHHITMTNIVDSLPFVFNKVDTLDTLDFKLLPKD